MKRILLKFIYINIILIFLLFYKDVNLNINSYNLIISNYKYNLVQWEIENIFDKWINKLTSPLFNNYKKENHEIVQDYFNNKRKILNSNKNFKNIDSETYNLQIEISENTDVVEEFIESTLSTVISNQNIDLIFGMQFPPVDIRLIDLPKLLVISPRNKIERIDDILIKPEIKFNDVSYIEKKILYEENLAAIVLDIGGIATYPSSIPNSRNLKEVFIISGHEWIHHYLFFTKLGQNMFNSEEMRILNETLASRVAEELWIYIDQYISENYDLHLNDENYDDFNQNHDNLFNFKYEMNKTRIETELLLKDNKIIEAEKFMERRRQIFVENGYNIRKLNQAYFAFYSSYADSSASNTSIGDELDEFRKYYNSLESFILAIRSVSDYEEFKNKLYKLRIE